MQTFIIIVLLVIIAALLTYLFYIRFKKDKKMKDPDVYIEGLKASLEGRDEAAFSKFREVVSEDSGNIDAYLRIGTILRKHGKADKALEVHKDLTIRHDLSDREKTKILTELTLDFIDLEDYDSARAALKELVSMDNHNRWAMEKLLHIYTCQSRWDEAYTTRENLLKIDHEKSKAPLAIYKFLQASRIYEDKDYHKARVIFKEAINLDNRCAPAYLFIGDSYMAENRVDDAVDIWRKMIKVIPDEAHLVLNRLKKALFEIGRFGDISDICQEVLKVSPNNQEALLVLADYHSKKGEYNLALEFLTRAFDEHPDSRLPAIQLAKHYLLLDDKKKLTDLIRKLDEKFQIIEREYSCRRCGYKSKQKLWLCPECRAVDTFVI